MTNTWTPYKWPAGPVLSLSNIYDPFQPLLLVLHNLKPLITLRDILTMAPGLVEQPNSGPAASFSKALNGPKEAFIGGPQAYNEGVEKRGTEKQPPAAHTNYLPVWDAETR